MRDIPLALRVALALNLATLVADIALSWVWPDAWTLAGYAMVAVAILSIASLTGFAIGIVGVARATVTGMRPIWLHASAVTALMSAHVAIVHLPLFVRTPSLSGLLFRDFPSESGRDSTMGNALHALATSWSKVAPLLALASVLLVAPIAIMHWRSLAAGADDSPSTWPLLVALASGVIGAVVMARLSVAAGDAMPDEPVLPTAIAR